MIDYPTTLEEARAYKYNRWGGNPGGNYNREGDCSYEVWPPGNWGSYQCSRKNGHGPAGLYCKQHAKIVEGE